MKLLLWQTLSDFTSCFDQICHSIILLVVRKVLCAHIGPLLLSVGCLRNQELKPSRTDYSISVLNFFKLEQHEQMISRSEERIMDFVIIVSSPSESVLTCMSAKRGVVHNRTGAIGTLTPISGALASDPFHRRKQGYSLKGGRGWKIWIRSLQIPSHLLWIQCGYVFSKLRLELLSLTLQITALNNKRKTIIDNINFFPLFKDIECNVWPAGDRGYQGTQQKHHSVAAGSHCRGPQWQMTVRSSQWCQISVAVLRHSGKGVNVSMTVSERERWRLCELYLKVFAKPKRIPVLAHFAESDWRA